MSLSGRFDPAVLSGAVTATAIATAESRSVIGVETPGLQSALCWRAVPAQSSPMAPIPREAFCIGWSSGPRKPLMTSPRSETTSPHVLRYWRRRRKKSACSIRCRRRRLSDTEVCPGLSGLSHMHLLREFCILIFPEIELNPRCFFGRSRSF